MAGAPGVIAADVWESARFMSIFLRSKRILLSTLPYPSHTRLTPAVGRLFMCIGEIR
jgi:hypothetical protein